MGQESDEMADRLAKEGTRLKWEDNLSKTRFKSDLIILIGRNRKGNSSMVNM